jgi:sporulation protein YlmC with PRC-barrel domain
MLHNMQEIKSYDIVAIDGSIGTVHDILIDDKHWTVRYLVVDTVKWLPGKKVLISPMHIKDFDLVNGNVELSLTKDKIKNSPPIDMDLPVSKEYELEYSNYFGLRPYWNGHSFWGPYVYPTQLAESTQTNEDYIPDVEHPEEANLRSFKEISGYGIEAKDGGIGHVENFVISDETWNVRYLVVDTSNWWVGKHVLVAPLWINYVSWHDKVVYVDLKKDTIENGPEYDPNQGITQDFEDEIFTRYDKDKPKYWF